MHLDQRTLEDLLENLRKELPPVFTRSAVPRLLGGCIASGTLANCDCAKEGPDGSFRMGRKICYRREPFLEWFGKQLSPARRTER